MKVLVSGPVESEEGWNTLAQRVSELHTGKHGPFDLLIVIPSTSGSTRSDAIHFPVQLAVDSGIYGQHLSIEVARSNQTEVKPLSSIVDVLLTETLPENSGAPNIQASNGLNGEWALATCPRYHFCGGSQSFFQRAPYRNGPGRSVTRLIALCPVGSSDKWIHALNLSSTENSTVEPPGTTENPYTIKLISKGAPSSIHTHSGPSQFFFGSDSRAAAISSRNKRNKPDQSGKTKRPRIAPRADCWFCLASTTCEQHLLAHIGEDTYVALPKGGIRKEHVLIVPISHEANFAHFIKEEEALAEVVEVQAIVEKAFAADGFGVLYTDRCLALDKAPQQHGYLEALPIPVDRLAEVESAFHAEAKSLGLVFERVGDGENKNNLKSLQGLEQYLFVQLPGGNAYVHRVDKAAIEDTRLRNALLQFGRILACKLMGCPERSNWKSCVASKTQETDWTKKFAIVMNSAD